MSSRNKLAPENLSDRNLSEEMSAVETEYPVLDSLTAAALENFKSSLNAWSGSAYSRPRRAVRTVRHAGASWRLAATWVIACMLAAGSLAGGLYERHQRQEQARVAAAKAAQQKATQKLDLTKNAPEQRV